MTIAMDIVLLPPPELQDEVVKFNRSLKTHDVEQIRFDRESIPHLSLGMACIPEKEISNYFRKVSADFDGLELQIKDTASQTRPGEKDAVFQLRFEVSKKLQKLHETVMEGLTSTHREKPVPDMFTGQEKISEKTVDYVADFLEKHAFDNFSPHITLGFGEAMYFIEPKKYFFNTMAICHLGNHNTCREILEEKRS